MNILKIIKNWLLELYLSNSMIEYKYLYISQKKLNKYIEKKAYELSESENIKVFNVSFDEINKNIKDEDSKAVGRFLYVKNENVVEYFYNLSKIILTDKSYNDIRYYSIPRIELTEQSDSFVFIHELGHYFIYKRELEQSEAAADAYCEEFFDKYLPSFFKWIYQIEIKVRANKNINFTKLECYNYFKEYKEWIKNNPEYFE